MASRTTFIIIELFVCVSSCLSTFDVANIEVGKKFEVVCHNVMRSTTYAIQHWTVNTSVLVAYIPHTYPMYTAKLLGTVEQFDHYTAFTCSTRSWQLINGSYVVSDIRDTRQFNLPSKPRKIITNVVYYKENEIFYLTCRSRSESSKNMYWIKTDDKDQIQESHYNVGLKTQLVVPFVLTKNDHNTRVYCIQYFNESSSSRRMMITYRRHVIKGVKFIMADQGQGDMTILIGSIVGAVILLSSLFICCWRCCKRNSIKNPAPPEPDVPVYEEIPYDTCTSNKVYLSTE